MACGGISIQEVTESNDPAVEDNPFSHPCHTQYNDNENCIQVLFVDNTVNMVGGEMKVEGQFFRSEVLGDPRPDYQEFGHQWAYFEKIVYDGKIMGEVRIDVTENTIGGAVHWSELFVPIGGHGFDGEVCEDPKIFSERPYTDLRGLQIKINGEASDYNLRPRETDNYGCVLRADAYPVLYW